MQSLINILDYSDKYGNKIKIKNFLTCRINFKFSIHEFWHKTLQFLLYMLLKG